MIPPTYNTDATCACTDMYSDFRVTTTNTTTSTSDVLEYFDSAVYCEYVAPSEKKPKQKHVHPQMDELYTVVPYISHHVVYMHSHRKMLFHKSGHLPSKIRKRYRNK